MAWIPAIRCLPPHAWVRGAVAPSRKEGPGCHRRKICFQNPAIWYHEHQKVASVGVKYGTVKREKLVLLNRMKRRRLTCWGTAEAQWFTAEVQVPSGHPLAPPLSAYLTIWISKQLCLLLRLAEILWHCVKTARHIAEILSPLCSSPVVPFLSEDRTYFICLFNIYLFRHICYF